MLPYAALLASACEFISYEDLIRRLLFVHLWVLISLFSFFFCYVTPAVPGTPYWPLLVSEFFVCGAQRNTVHLAAATGLFAASAGAWSALLNGILTGVLQKQSLPRPSLHCLSSRGLKQHYAASYLFVYARQGRFICVASPSVVHKAEKTSPH